MIESTEKILTPASREFIDALHREFNERRLNLLEKRQVVQARLNQGELLQFASETEKIRKDPHWKVSDAPKDLQKRWVEITGPCERKMMINALNSGADVFMADFEDALSPTWQNVIQGQENLIDAVRKELTFTSPEGKVYELKEKLATLLVRPRGWHLAEKHHEVDGEPISASLFDFGLYLFHNARSLLEQGTGPYFYLPKLESWHEAKLWADVFAFSEKKLKLPLRSIKATVLIETIPAAFEMEEILYALKDYIVGLNAGRWDYIFSIIKKFAFHPFVFPDRSLITMEAGFMRAYTTLLVQTCHRRKCHAIGGMAAFIPSRKDPELNAASFEKVTKDKLRETSDGFDGTWVAHPDLVEVAQGVFANKLKKLLHQKTVIPEKKVAEEDLLQFAIPGGQITESGIRQNISVTLQYLNAWLNGVGAAAIANLMEDTATAEIARAQLWQWIHHPNVVTAEGKAVDFPFVLELMEEEKAHLPSSEEAKRAFDLLKSLVEREAFTEFLTLEAYQHLP
jgi:malate synthase